MLTNVLRGEWGFDGHVISDCDTVSSIHEAFHYTAGMQQSVAIALKAGNDLNCGPEFSNLENATISGFVTESDIDVAVKRLLRRRVQVGDLDLPAAGDPYGSIPYSVVDSPKHQALARQAVAESTVVLHNGASLFFPLYFPLIVSLVLCVYYALKEARCCSHTNMENRNNPLRVAPYASRISVLVCLCVPSLLHNCHRHGGDRACAAVKTRKELCSHRTIR